jgi:nucleoside-diphosphate-sugar epimerase
MRVIVTGAAGFCGPHVVEAIRAAGHAVLGIDEPECDLVYEDTKLPAILDHAEVVVHLAAQPVVSWQGATHTWVNNVEGTRSLLERLPPTIRRVVFVSSSCVYGDDLSDGSRTIGPVSIYGASKLAGEALVSAYAARFGFSFAILRPVAIYGRGYRRGHVADFVRRYRNDGRVTAFDDGSQTKWGIHVSDVARTIAAEVTRKKSVTYDLATGPWSWRDTARVMGIVVEPGPSAAGFAGDAIRHADYHNAIGAHAMSVESGVRDALLSLGWERP